MIAEFQGLEKKGTFEITKRPENKRIISSKWTYRLKTNEKGEPIRFKARICARGFTQEPGVDYFETASPVIKIATLRLVICLAQHLRMKIYQLDVVQADLNSYLNEEIYMSPPPGINIGQNNVQLLKKSLYGLKQSGRNWNIDLTNWLLEYGMEQSKHEECLYQL